MCRGFESLFRYQISFKPLETRAFLLPKMLIFRWDTGVGHNTGTLRKIKTIWGIVFMRKAMKHTEQNGNAGELMLELVLKTESKITLILK